MIFHSLNTTHSELRQGAASKSPILSTITKSVCIISISVENIGQGGFASVHRAVELHTNTDVAVKIVNLEGLSSKDYEHLRR